MQSIHLDPIEPVVADPDALETELLVERQMMASTEDQEPAEGLLVLVEESCRAVVVGGMVAGMG